MQTSNHKIMNVLRFRCSSSFCLKQTQLEQGTFQPSAPEGFQQDRKYRRNDHQVLGNAGQRMHPLLDWAREMGVRCRQPACECRPESVEKTSANHRKNVFNTSLYTTVGQTWAYINATVLAKLLVTISRPTINLSVLATQR